MKNIFISYGDSDLKTVRMMHKSLKSIVRVDFWDKSKRPGKANWKQIFNWIKRSDLVLALVTEKTVSKSMSVGQEIGYAKAIGVDVVPIVQSLKLVTELGSLSGVTCIDMSKSDFMSKIRKIVSSKKTTILSELEFKKMSMLDKRKKFILFSRNYLIKQKYKFISDAAMALGFKGKKIMTSAVTVDFFPLLTKSILKHHWACSHAPETPHEIFNIGKNKFIKLKKRHVLLCSMNRFTNDKFMQANITSEEIKPNVFRAFKHNTNTNHQLEVIYYLIDEVTSHNELQNRDFHLID